jgi:N-acetylmuramoyl-L-alanine amidase
MEQEIDSLKNSNASVLQELEKLKEQIRELENGPTPDEPNDKIKIYIDQGHNPTSYHNSGAEGNGLYEQDLTYTIGILLAELLAEDDRFEIRLSRPTETTVLGTDTDSSLDARVQGATDFGADYFISLHVNSFTSSSATGIEVYTIEPSGVSYDFGSALLQGLIESTGMNNRGMEQKDFRVIKNATMPAALLEMGFISNPDDAALLSKQPQLFAQGIYNGILNYFDLPSNDSSAN